MVPASRFRWIEVRVGKEIVLKRIRIMMRNPGEESQIELAQADERMNLVNGNHIVAPIPAKWSGWIELGLEGILSNRRFKIVLPKGKPRFLIGGIVFREGAMNWPWEEKAELSFQPREAETGPIAVSFDPAKILPEPLNRRKIRVLDDHGSSVLFAIEQ